MGQTRLRMSYFITEDEPAKVARFYKSYWEERRFFVREDITHLGGMVSAVNPEEEIVYQVLIVPRGNKSEVFPSVTHDPLKAAQSEGQLPAIPLFPESKAVLAMGSEEGEVQSRIHFSTNEGGLEANLSHYRAALKGAGYLPEMTKEPDLPPEQKILLYRKGSQEITVNLTALDKKRVRVQIMEVGS